MTRSDVFMQILSEIAKEHKEEVKELLETFQSTVPNLNKFDKELSADEAEQFLLDFRRDKDSIRVWLLQGRNHFVSRAKKTQGSK
ncbi:MAG: hypothetical protein NTV58_02275 [Deltaproteobacteria bacterium]|nr:hypothetical protein [Deltaproteobacteria bacterium]